MDFDHKFALTQEKYGQNGSKIGKNLVFLIASKSAQKCFLQKFWLSGGETKFISGRQFSGISLHFYLWESGTDDPDGRVLVHP